MGEERDGFGFVLAARGICAKEGSPWAAPSSSRTRSARPGGAPALQVPPQWGDISILVVSWTVAVLAGTPYLQRAASSTW